MKKTISALLAFALLLAPAALAVSALDATNAAKTAAPENAAYLYTEKDDGVYEVHFAVSETNETYEIDVDATTGAVLRLDSEVENATGSASAAIADEAAFQAVLAEYPDAALAGVLHVLDDGFYEARVYFTAAGIHGVYALNAETGAILARDIVFKDVAGNWTETFDDEDDDEIVVKGQLSGKGGRNGKGADSAAEGVISQDSAIGIITDKYPGAKVTEIEFDKDHKRYVYEGEAQYKGAKYDFEIDAATGKLLEWKLDD